MARFVDKPPQEKPDRQRALQIRPDSGAIGRVASGGGAKPTQGRIPNASIVYGCAAAVLMLIALYIMFKLANWFTGLLVLILSFTLFGYAYYFMRYR